MKKRLNPWFVFGLSLWALWAGWMLWALAFGPNEPYGGHWPEFDYEPSIWVTVLVALFPGVLLFYVVPRQIEDNGKRWWHPGVLNEMVVSWATNIVQVIVAIAVIGGLGNLTMFIVTFYDGPSGYLGPEWFYDQLARCEKLEAELKVDEQCVFSDDCTMRRDELESYNERREKHVRYCVNKPSFE